MINTNLPIAVAEGDKMRAAPIRRRAAAAVLCIALLAAGPARAVDPAMVEAARKEGIVVWYSGLIVNQVVRPVSDGFERKYPGIKVQGSRLTSSEAALKIMNEARAGRPQADVFDGTALVFRLEAAGVVEHYKPEAAAAFPDGSKEPNGVWTAFNTYIMTPAVNTDTVAAKDIPKTLQDLLDPKWRGRMAWTNDPTTAGPPGFIGNVLAAMGQQAGMDYLRHLAQQRIVNVPAAQRVVLDQVIGGQYALALMTFNNHSVISANDGAPVRWLPIEPAVQLPNPGGLIRNAPHPNAAKLLLEYILSPEGQAVFRDANYIPANPAVPPKDTTLTPTGGGFATTLITPETTAAKLEGWVAIYNELFK
jgi:ABC-type Fe3+ transport system substrate-binding protein